MKAAIKAAGQDHDTLGGVFEVWAFDPLPGLGSHVTGDARLDGRLGQALMGIQAIKGVELGAGFALGRDPRQRGARRDLPRARARLLPPHQPLGRASRAA